MKLRECQDYNETEKCVCCGKTTPYTFGIPIQERRFYVRGCGQLCEQCDIRIKDPEGE